MTDLPLFPLDTNGDQAFILTGAERMAIRDARLIVHLVRSGQLEEARDLATMSEGHFLDELDPLADRVQHADRVGRRKIGEWMREWRERGRPDGE